MSAVFWRGKRYIESWYFVCYWIGWKHGLSLSMDHEIGHNTTKGANVNGSSWVSQQVKHAYFVSIL